MGMTFQRVYGIPVELFSGIRIREVARVKTE
jgi:hypothetical protein